MYKIETIATGGTPKTQYQGHLTDAQIKTAIEKGALSGANADFGTTGTVTLYDTDGTTVLFTFSI